MLRDQVTMLYDIIYRDHQGYARHQGLGDGSSLAKEAQPPASSYPLNQFLDRYPPNKNIFQPEQGPVAPRARSSNDAPGSYAPRTGEIHSTNTNNPLAPCGPSPFATMWPSRIPRIFDPVVRKTCLHNHVFGMLPDPAVARKLSKTYLEGPFHRGWPVGLLYAYATCGIHSSSSRSYTPPPSGRKKQLSLLSRPMSNVSRQILHGLRYT